MKDEQDRQSMNPANSHAHGLSPIPLRNETIGQALDHAASAWPDQDAVVVCDQGVRLTYAALRREADRLASGFIALGLEPGDRIGIWSPNRIEWVLTHYAAARAGMILVCVNPAYRIAELAYALNKVECRALVTANRFKTTDYIGMLRALAPELEHCGPGALRAERLPHLTTLIQMGDAEEPGFHRFSAVMTLGQATGSARLTELAETIQADDPVNIQFTSGTTGAPKAATLTHQSLLNNAFFVGEICGIHAGDRYLTPLPLYHIGAMSCVALLSLTRGATVIYPGEAFDPLAVLEALRTERCTIFGGVPTMFIALLNHPRFGEFDLSRLRGGVVGGAPAPEVVMRRMIAEMNLRDVCNVYGMTETSPISLQTRPDDTMARRVGTVGRPHPHIEVKITGPDGRVVPRGTQGEICVRGYSVMLGYWNGEDATREAIDPARWMHTGDLGVMDEHDYVTITGRSKDMVIRGGENIYPAEVEALIARHPAVADVQGFGVPDPYFGEELCVWIRPRPGAVMDEEEIRAFCRGRITHFKIPRHVRFVDEYPMTVTGKVQKFVMREMMAKELGQTG
jgi:fatty-acyl-CoA synthase